MDHSLYPTPVLFARPTSSGTTPNTTRTPFPRVQKILENDLPATLIITIAKCISLRMCVYGLVITFREVHYESRTLALFFSRSFQSISERLLQRSLQDAALHCAALHCLSSCQTITNYYTRYIDRAWELSTRGADNNEVGTGR